MAEPVEAENKAQPPKWGSLNFMMIILIIIIVIGGVLIGAEIVRLDNRISVVEDGLRDFTPYVEARTKAQKTKTPATKPATPAATPAGK
ncbi:MAG: hypothetical protein HZA50_16370 [Planctomycetes bacterium]|nr:hypothetical protein [Planctomycetota bacterium]